MSVWTRHIRPRLKLWRDKRDLLLLFASVVYFILCIYIVAVANAYADRKQTNRGLPPEQRYVAPDAIMDATNPWFIRSGMPETISDTLVAISAALLFMFAFTRGIACVTLLRRGLLIVGSLYLGRVPYMFLTVLPAPYRSCFTDVDPNYGKDTWLLFTGQRVDCGDTFYSGHTIVFSSSALLYWYHCRYFIITIPVLAFNIFGAISLIFTTYHYTIDVLGSFFFTFLVWWLYHLTVEVGELRHGRWWGRVIGWWDHRGWEVIESKEGKKQLMMAALGRKIGIGRDTGATVEEMRVHPAPTVAPLEADESASISGRSRNSSSRPREHVVDLDTEAVIISERESRYG